MDAVGNILAEREREKVSWSVGVSLALILHLGIAAGLIASAIQRRGPLINPRAVSVRILPAGSLRGGAARRAAPQPPEQRKIVKPPEEEPPPPSEKAVLLPAPEDEKKKPAPPAPATAPRAEERAPDVSLPGAGQTEGAGGGGAVGAGGNVGVGGARFDQADFTYSYYIERMLVAIGTNWFKPNQSGDASPIVYFRIERDGAINDPVIEKSSGLPFVDRAALRAVMASSPLPPLPLEYRGTHLGVHLRFE
ncbi:MAG: energy transducer TonB [Thermoanaerobaculia bacterium]